MLCARAGWSIQILLCSITLSSAFSKPEQFEHAEYVANLLVIVV